jgi:hypothetical protein
MIARQHRPHARAHELHVAAAAERLEQRSGARQQLERFAALLEQPAIARRCCARLRRCRRLTNASMVPQSREPLQRLEAVE